jgi:tetratricopeptide (TPR) repeat protein
VSDRPLSFCPKARQFTIMQEDDPRNILVQLRSAISDRNRKEINRLSTRLIDQNAKLGEQWKSITALLQHNGEFKAANLAMSLYVKQHGNLAAARFDQAAILAQTGNIEAASQIMAALPTTVPDRVGNAYVRATIAINMGNNDTAKSCFLELLDINPMSGQGWLGLSMLGKMDDHSADRMLALRPQFLSQTSTERATYLYAASRVLDGRGDFDAAFSAVSEGAGLERQARPYRKESDRQNAECVLRGWPPYGTFAEPILHDNVPIRPIFVTGLPRSGTTLLEQILASHSEVIGGSELGLQRILSQDIGGITADDLQHYLSHGGSLQELKSLYVHLLAERATGRGFYVDKSLDTSRYLGLIATIMPDAPLIWVRRDPLDCAWSAYRTYFMRGVAWSWSLTDIAHHFKLEDNLCLMWQEQLGSRLMVIDYTELVEAPEIQIRKIAKHCGLSFENEMLNPESTKRIVTTASASQVRQPISTTSLGASEPYRKHLKPFIDAYF